MKDEAEQLAKHAQTRLCFDRAKSCTLLLAWNVGSTLGAEIVFPSSPVPSTRTIFASSHSPEVKERFSERSASGRQLPLVVYDGPKGAKRSSIFQS